MTTTPKEYQDQLWSIQNDNPPKIAHLPFAKEVYDLDVKSRTIQAPDYISVLKDHKAKNIYFRVDRFVDYIDLSQMVCIIQYTTTEGSTGIYPVPYYDIYTYRNENKMLIPWLPEVNATVETGKIEFTIRFYKINDNNNKFLYQLSFLPTTTKILNGMDVQADDLTGKYDINPTAYDTLLARLSELSRQDVFWITM